MDHVAHSLLHPFPDISPGDRDDTEPIFYIQLITFLWWKKHILPNAGKPFSIRGFEPSGLVEDAPAHVKGIGSIWHFKVPSNKTLPWSGCPCGREQTRFSVSFLLLKPGMLIVTDELCNHINIIYSSESHRNITFSRRSCTSFLCFYHRWKNSTTKKYNA